MPLIANTYRWDISIIMQDNVKIEASRCELSEDTGFVRFFDISAHLVMAIKMEHFIYAKRGDKVSS